MYFKGLFSVGLIHKHSHVDAGWKKADVSIPRFSPQNVFSTFLVLKTFLLNEMKFKQSHAAIEHSLMLKIFCLATTVPMCIPF